MYEKFYGFRAKPFQLNPDPSFYFASSQHRRAMAYLDYGLHQSEGFIVVTGEVGAGKTTLVRSLLAKLDPAKVVAANIVTTQLDADDMVRMVAAAFGVPTRGTPKAELLLSLEALLSAQARDGRRCLLIVDEAQNLTPRAVEELRMLSNFQLGSHALLQSFLVGQPEFRLILQSPQLSQLRQRVIAACHVGPLSPEDTRSYIEHRLRHVGWTGNPRISDDAFARIFEASGGVPRRINLICDRTLLAGYLAERRSISAEDVGEVADEIGGETRAPQRAHALATAGEAVIAGGGLLDSGYPAHPEYGLADRNGEPPDAHLHQVEQEMRDLKAALMRVERGNQATLGLFRRFLDWMRTQEADREERH
jgi:putative secretion ATPase (PEP-CTERM system associated)